MKITVAHGDGIGPEVMDAVLRVFDAARVPLEYDIVEMGAKAAIFGDKTGIGPEARESVESTGVLFKGPMASVNLTARKMWGTFANKRVYRLLPGVPTPLRLSDFNLTMVRENIEDTYGAVEHMQTHDVAQCRRFISKPGSEQVHRYTFEMAARKGSKRVTCGHNANIMKLTDGLFLKTFYEVAKDYPDIAADDVLIDALAMKLVYDPSEFEVIVMPNLQGDILTDLAAGLVGGLAYAPSANLGDGISIFEAVHGTAPDIAGRDLANPSALLLSGTMMLRHLGLPEHARVIEDALNYTLVRMHKRPDLGYPVFRTTAFVDTMLGRLGQLELPVTSAVAATPFVRRFEPVMRVSDAPAETRLRGVDLFVESALTPRAIAEQLEPLGTPESGMKLVMITNRGTQVWPTGSAYTDCVNNYRVRFEGNTVDQNQLVRLLGAACERFPLCGAEWLREIDGERGYSLAQGQSA